MAASIEGEGLRRSRMETLHRPDNLTRSENPEAIDTAGDRIPNCNCGTNLARQINESWTAGAWNQRFRCGSLPGTIAAARLIASPRAPAIWCVFASRS